MRSLLIFTVSLLGFLLIILLPSSLLSQPTVKLESHVTAVTVYPNRALIQREGKITLRKGQYQLIVPDLTPDLLDGSVRVSGKGEHRVRIEDVKVETVHTAEIQNKKVKLLQSKIDSLQNEVDKSSDRIDVLKTQQEFLESIKTETPREINKELLVKKPTIQDWQNLLAFLKTNLTAILAKIRQEKLFQKEIKNKIDALKKEIRHIVNAEPRQYKRILVTLNSAAPGTATVRITYIVNSASWFPMYDARIQSDSRETTFIYYGMVQQATGEDWNDVQLALSTAQPLTTPSLPELEPLYIDVEAPNPTRDELQISSRYVNVSYQKKNSLPGGYGLISGKIIDKQSGEALPGANVTIEGKNLGRATNTNGSFQFPPIPVGNYTLRVDYLGYQPLKAQVLVLDKEDARLTIGLTPSAIEGTGEIFVVAERPAKEMGFTYSLASIDKNLLSTTFKVPGKSNIPADNTSHKKIIAVHKLPVAFENIAIPGYVEKVFLKGKVVNTSDYPFISGDVNIFLDDVFVNKSFIPNFVPNDTINLSVGIDERIKVSRKLINKYTESKGLLGGKHKIKYEFEFALLNTKRIPVIVTLLDRLPISRNEKIKIKLIEPSKGTVEIDSQNRIKWRVTVPPGETKRLPFKFSIEFPKDARVKGLERF